MYLSFQHSCGKLCGMCGKKGLINVLRSCDLSAQSITQPLKCQDPHYHKIPTQPSESIRDPHKYSEGLDIFSLASYTT